MSHSPHKLACCAAVGLIFTVILVATRQPPLPTAQADELKADGPLRWYRGNIHTHSLWSDGDDYPEMIAQWYRDHDYQFLCFTDHNTLATTERWSDVLKNKGGQPAFAELKRQFPNRWIDQRTTNGRIEVRLKTFPEIADRFNKPEQFLVIQGEEITDRYKNLPVHMNATNLQSLIPPLHGDSVYATMQNNVNAVIAQRERTKQPMLIHLNHPNFGYGVTAEDLMRVRGENFFEVYNGHPGVKNSGDRQHASTERIWDIILTRRISELDLPIMYGLATDDGHNYHNIPSRASEPGRGWIVVLASALTPDSLIEALEQGRFYASSGVALQRITSSTTHLEVAVAASKDVTYTIEFLGTRKGYERDHQPVVDGQGKAIAATHVYSPQLGQVLKTVTGHSARYDFEGDELYVRARITSSRLHPNPSEPGEFERAWAQPVKGPAAP